MIGVKLPAFNPAHGQKYGQPVRIELTMILKEIRYVLK